MLTLSPLLGVLLACSEPDKGLGSAATTDTDPVGADTSADDTSADDTADTDAPASALVFTGERPTNLLMISWDTTRADRLQRYGGGPEMDTVEALFAGGVALDNHRSCSSWTWASVVCAMTGASDVEQGYIPTSHEDYLGNAPDALLWGSEVLRDQGYQTALVATNSWFSADVNMSQGFQHEAYDWGGKADWSTAAALGFFEDGVLDPAEPWYLHVHYMDPHIAYKPPEGYRSEVDGLPELADYDLEAKPGYWDLEEAWAGLDADTRALAWEHLDARYRGELAYTDDQLALLLDELGALGALEDTLIVFWTDHGEQLLEHGSVGHGNSLFEEENRALAAFSAPGLAPQPWSGPTTHQDLWPTTLDALGLPAPSSWTGLPVGAREPDAHRFALRHDGAADRVLQFVERGGSKLIYSWSGEKALYRIGDDPGELNDRYDPEDSEVIALWSLLGPEVEAVEAVHPSWTPIDPNP